MKGMLRTEKERFKEYTPLTLQPAELLEVATDHPNYKFPYSAKRGARNPKSNLYYRFHNDYGNDTNDCKHLKGTIERMIQDRHLVEFVKKE